MSPSGFARLAAAVRLDAVADLAVDVGRAARRPVVLDREVAVRALAVRRSGRRRSRPSSRRRSRSTRATLRPTRKPARNTVAAASTQTGQTAAPRGGAVARARSRAQRSEQPERAPDRRAASP